MRTLDNAATAQALKPQWEKFVQAYIANGGNGADAYSSVYPNCQKMEVASAAATRLLKTVKVRARIAELQEQAAEQAVITLESLITEAGELQKQAAQLGQISAGVAALTLKAKLAGFHIDRTENVNLNGNYAISDKPMTEAEWVKNHVTEH